MKKITQLLTALAFCSLMVFISCGPSDDKPEPDARIEIGNNFATVATGAPTSVTLDGAARDEWGSFSLTVNYDGDANVAGGTYSVSGVPADAGADAVWGAGGAWTFDETGSTVTFDGKTATLTASETSVSLTFTVAPASGRAATFDGTWVFTW